MSVVRTLKWSLRLEPAESFRLARSLGYSLASHMFMVLLWLLIITGQRLHWWDRVHLPTWLQSHKTPAQAVKAATPPPQLQEPPLMFVDVSSAQASAEPPKDAKFYSDKNSLAANPEADKDTDTPKIAGTQTHVPKAEDVPRKEFLPLQPARPAQPAREEQEEQKAKPLEVPGALAMAKPELAPRPTDGQAPRERPRTIKEAKARLPENRLPGQKMQQEGGVRRHLEISSLDAKATPFGAYDAALVEAISQRWYALLDERSFASDSRGKVVLHFVLHQDGRVSDMTVAENNAGEVLGLLCEKAVLDPAPFAAFPGDMRRMAGETRAIQFTFFYN